MNKTQQIIGLLITKDYIQKPENFIKTLFILMTNNLLALMGDKWSIIEVDEKKPHIKGLLNDLAFLLSSNQIESRHAKKILEDAWEFESDTWDLSWYLLDVKLLEETSGDNLREIVARIIEENPKAKADMEKGKKKVIGFLVGQIMKETKGKTDPNQAKEEIEKYIGIKEHG